MATLRILHSDEQNVKTDQLRRKVNINFILTMFEKLYIRVVHTVINKWL